METMLILAAAVVALAALTVVSVLLARDARPPLRTRREEDLADGDEEGLIASLRPVPASPIDRNAPIIEIAPIAAALAEGGLIEGRVVRARTAGDEAEEAREGQGTAQAPERAADAAPEPPPGAPGRDRP